jgi:hypothetical protein
MCAAFTAIAEQRKKVIVVKLNEKPGWPLPPRCRRLELGEPGGPARANPLTFRRENRVKLLKKLGE